MLCSVNNICKSKQLVANYLHGKCTVKINNQTCKPRARPPFEGVLRIILIFPSVHIHSP